MRSALITLFPRILRLTKEFDDAGRRRTVKEHDDRDCDNRPISSHYYLIMSMEFRDRWSSFRPL